MPALACAFALASLVTFSQPAAAQQVAAFVNGDPITSFDVEQRAKINGAMGKGANRQTALSDLIEDKIKIAEARRIGYRLSEDNVDDQITRIARSNRQTLNEFMANLARLGIEGHSYRSKIKAEYSWDLALEKKVQDVGNGDPEVDKIVEKKLKEGAGKVTDFVVQSVIFVVPHGTNPAVRERDANAARARFTDCQTGIEAMRQIRDVAIRAPVKRASDQLSPQLAALLHKTPVNKTTPPMRTEQGVELIAMCEKIERMDTGSVRAQAEQEVKQKRRAEQATAYLKELRSKAVVQTGSGATMR